jgi:hypothetical protein
MWDTIFTSSCELFLVANTPSIMPPTVPHEQPMRQIYQELDSMIKRLKRATHSLSPTAEKGVKVEYLNLETYHRHPAKDPVVDKAGRDRWTASIKGYEQMIGLDWARLKALDDVRVQMNKD